MLVLAFVLVLALLLVFVLVLLLVLVVEVTRKLAGRRKALLAYDLG